jgi:3-dehydroquinate dehydratase I
MICVSVIEPDFDKCLKIIKKVGLAEIRLDEVDFSDEQIKHLFALQVKTVATCRPGRYNDEERLHKLSVAIQSGATYVDVEIESTETLKKELKVLAVKHNCKFIVSYHNYNETPIVSELDSIVKQCVDDGADVVKIACLVNNVADNACLMGLYRSNLKMIILGMGEKGKISRIAAPYLGSEFTFAAVSEKTATAPGQYAISQLQKIYKAIDE